MARYLRVIATFSPTARESLYYVSFYKVLVAPLLLWASRGWALWSCGTQITSSFPKSALRLPYSPCSGLSVIQRQTYHLLSWRRANYRRKSCAYISARLMFDLYVWAKNSMIVFVSIVVKLEWHTRRPFRIRRENQPRNHHFVTHKKLMERMSSLPSGYIRVWNELFGITRNDPYKLVSVSNGTQTIYIESFRKVTVSNNTPIETCDYT